MFKNRCSCVNHLKANISHAISQSIHGHMTRNVFEFVKVKFFGCELFDLGMNGLKLLLPKKYQGCRASST